MFCPQCGVEYREGFQECCDCGVRLVAQRPARLTHKEPSHASDSQEIAFEPVLVSKNPSVIGIAESLLQATGIRYWSRGEWTPYGRLGGSVELMVERKHADAARRVVAALQGGGSRRP